MVESGPMDGKYARALEIAIGAAREAGALLVAELHRPGGPRGAGSHADADEEAEVAIRKRLTDAFPEWSYLGEETGRREGTAGHGPLDHLWLVGPNDGTAAFLRGLRSRRATPAVRGCSTTEAPGAPSAHRAPAHGPSGSPRSTGPGRAV